MIQNSSSDDNKKSNDFQPYFTAQKKKHFIDDRIVAALDALKLSDYQAVHIISAVALSLGHNLSDLVISRSTIQRAREENRKDTAAAVKFNFQVGMN